METPFTIREAEAGDAEAIQSVARESWHAAYDDFLGADTVDGIIDEWYALESLGSSIDSAESHVFVARRDTGRGREAGSADNTDGDRSSAVGFVHGGPWADEPSVAHLARLYVHSQYWGQGIGSALLERCETALEADGYERCRLEVFARNEDGVGFYTARGYEKTGGVLEELEDDTYQVLLLEKKLE